MRFKCFEVYLSYGEQKTSTVALEKRAERVVNEWLAQMPNITVLHFGQNMAEVNGAIVYQLGFLYADRDQSTPDGSQ
jgi:hypothetical protein